MHSQLMDKILQSMKENDHATIAPVKTTLTPITPRRRGRPPKSIQINHEGEPTISREQIIDRAVELTKNEPLAEISIIGLARDFGVTSALIHYYVGNRDDLISGVVNRYFQIRVEHLPDLTGNWRHDIEQHAFSGYSFMLEYGGVLRYIVSHNRFRLFQQVEPGQTDYGMMYMNRLAQIFRDGGFSPEQTAMAYHLISQYTTTTAYSEVNRQLPATHANFIRKRISQVSMEEYAAAHYMTEAFIKIDAYTAFQTGLHMLLDTMEQWIKSGTVNTSIKMKLDK